MYNYEWDPETGGYLLNTNITGVIKEVRPVFKEELRLLGFDKQFNWIIPDTELPLMWAEGRRYVYRGEIVGSVNGGGVFETPRLISMKNEFTIEPVNLSLMIDKNEELLNGLTQKTLKFIYTTFLEWQDKVDFTYVAFSGGKDSIVLLDLVSRALPHDKFHVVFADTTMEMEETYKAIDLSEKRWSDIKWHTAKSHLIAPNSWETIGYPAQKLRWCCTVHKTVPQVLLIKELLQKDNFTTLVYVGIRSEESDTRSQYENISLSKKHVMQTGCYPLLEWNTSELFIYILKNNLLMNNSYKKGLTRAGCVFCPLSSNWSFMINRKTNKNKTDDYINTIERQLNTQFQSEIMKRKYFNDRRWKHRLNGRDINIGNNRYIETIDDGIVNIFLNNPSSDWEIWASTIGTLFRETHDSFILDSGSIALRLNYSKIKNSVKFTFTELGKTQDSISFLHKLRNALQKATYCIGCRACEVECPVGAIKFMDGKLIIDGCIQCGNCLKRKRGCIVAESQTIPIGGTNMKKKSIASYQTRGLRQDWLNLFFELGPEFWGNERLGKNMFLSIKVWLREAGIISDLSITPLGSCLAKLEPRNLLVWSTIYNNLAYESALINWFVMDLEPFHAYNNQSLKELLEEQYTISVINSAIKSLKEIMKSTPIGTEMNVGICEMKGNSVISLTKSSWNNPEPLAILYSLFKYAEQSDKLFSFTLTNLYEDSTDINGISPVKLYNINREDLQTILYQLALDHSDFIKVVFNKDLENIYLNSEKTSLDVVDSFK